MKSKNLAEINWLAQGTNLHLRYYKSAVNSKTKAKVIKSHHNVGGLPKGMNLNLLEPFRMLFKDEVKKYWQRPNRLAKQGYRKTSFHRATGLGIRVIDEVNEIRLQKIERCRSSF
ncbi:MAG: hypothetical protein CM15mP12_3840 [Gammaproteobacteria bacterium]|nr:MAG: hypothetical protein CM15mP12_3840 [Gammaproteobacteria bacterium]